MAGHRRRPLPPHGRRVRYSHHGCRCDECAEAARLYLKRLRGKRTEPAHVPSCGTQRRLQALHRIGWSWLALSDHLNSTDKWPSLLANRPPPTVTRATEREIRDLYDRLSLTPGPSARARTWAAKRDWAPPLAWDDDSIDDPDATPNVGGSDTSVDHVLVARALAGRADFNSLNRAEQIDLWRAWERRRRTAGHDRSGLVEFQRRYGVTKDKAAALRLAAAGLNTRGNPIHSKTSQAQAA